MFSPGITALIENATPFHGNKFLEDSQKGMEHCKNARIFVIGAGGLGCEILKCLAFNGFKHIDIVDMDTIEVSNLNRQFLFRKKDVGRYKSEVAAEYVRNRVNGRFEGDVEINYHTCKIQEKGDDFYKQFDIVIGGLDNLEARFWMSTELVRIAQIYHKVIPYIDGGTAGWTGNIKVIFPSLTSCMECQRDKFPPQVTTYQACTLVSHPRKPEHCVFYARQIKWDEDRKDDTFDADNEEHIQWITDLANKHAKEFDLHYEIDNKFTRKVVKNTIAAIASTQAIIASMCCTEAFKILTDCAPFLSSKVNQDLSGLITNQVQFIGNSDYQGINFSHDKLERKANCPYCSPLDSMKYIPNETVGELMKRFEAEGILANVNSVKEDENPIVSVAFLGKKTSRENMKLPLDEFGVRVGTILSISNKEGKSTKVLLTE